MKKSKINLSLFEEKIQLEGVSPALETWAYRMDGNPEKNTKPMAQYAELGSPSCCDYLYIKKNEAVLIEDTSLGKSIKKIEVELKDLESEHKDNKLFRAKTILRQENCLKVYGALLILCRLAQQHEELAQELKPHKSYDFWLIINDEHDVKAIDNEDIQGIIDFLKQSLCKALAGSLVGAKLVKNVKILFADELKARLQQAEGA